MAVPPLVLTEAVHQDNAWTTWSRVLRGPVADDETKPLTGPHFTVLHRGLCAGGGQL
jgi:hypothetical protein